VRKDSGSTPDGKASTACEWHIRIDYCRIFVFALDALVNFFAVHRYVFGRIDADTHLVTFHTQDGNAYFITNHQSLTNSTSQNQHYFSPVWLAPIQSMQALQITDSCTS